MSTVYIYSAALHCAKCGEAIKERLISEGVLTTGALKDCDPDDDCSFDSDDFPKSACDSGGEADCPNHCDSCGEPLGNALTGDGVRYVLDAIREEIESAVRNGRAKEWDLIRDGEADYYKGSRLIECTRDWAKDLKAYNLEPEETALVDLFLELSEPV